MVVIDSAKPFMEIGVPPITRSAESPRPMPQMVRSPNISFIVANIEAITVQSLCTGFVTIGPTMTLDVAASMPGKIMKVSSHSTHDSTSTRG